MKMNLYLIEQNTNLSHGTYDLIIVAAYNEDAAREISPTDNRYIEWVELKDISKLDVKFIGVASPDVEEGVVLATLAG